MSIITDLGMRQWEATAPRGIRDDPIWRFHAYRASLYLLHLAREDVRAAREDARWAAVSGQLLRSVASVSANIAEGYGRPTPRDRMRFYDFALGSLREAATWYEGAKVFLPHDTAHARIDNLGEVRRMLFGAIRALRAVPPNTRLMG
jgi:four helix bundle protein